jgi:hypothetical protein
MIPTFFSPALPLGGVTGYKFLQRTADRQQATMEQSAYFKREVQYFRDNIGKADTAEKLVKDRRLMNIAMGAFGLGEETDKTFFIKKVLEEGTDDPSSFANRLNSTAFKDLADAFGYGNATGVRVNDPSFADDLIAKFSRQTFEIAVGEKDSDLRLALNFERRINDISPTRAGWFQIMGDQPMRKVLESALGLPKEFAKLDVDKQRETLEDRVGQLFGGKTPDVLADPQNMDKLIRRFLVRQQVDNGPNASTPGMAALSLLQNAVGFASRQNLFLSRL